jgi:hypothetical protein
MSRNLFVILLLILPCQLVAQVPIHVAVDWSIPETQSQKREQLELFKKIGVKTVQIEGVVDRETLDLLMDLKFEIWVSSGLTYYRPSDHPDQTLFLDRITDPLFYYRNNGITVHRYTLFEHPLFGRDFESLLSDLVLSVRNVYQGRLDILTIPSLDLTPISDLTRSVAISDTVDLLRNMSRASDSGYIYVTRNLLDQNAPRMLREIWTHEAKLDYVWMFNSTDLIHALAEIPDLQRLMTAFTTDRQAVIALEPLKISDENQAVITILILILITLFAAVFGTNASYQRSVTRYLFTHNFYVSDVLLKRTRFTGAVPLSWLLSVFFGTLLTWLTIDRVLTVISLDMVKYHYPWLGDVLSGGIISVLLLGSIAIITVQFLMFSWVFLTCYAKTGPGQIAQLILVPQQLIIPLAIVASLVYLNSNSPVFMIYSFSLGMGLIFISMPVTCIDIISHSPGKSTIQWLFGPLLFAILLGASIYYILIYTSVPDTIRLLIQLY